MLDLSIVIGDLDQAFNKKLSNYLSLSRRYNFSVQAFSSAKNLSNYLKYNSCNILLITVELYNLIKIQLSDGIVMLLVDDEIDPNYLELPMVFKYQMGIKIEEGIIKNYCKYSKKESVNLKDKDVEIIGIYSPIGGSGKSSIAAGISKLYAYEGHKTLFFSLEDITSNEWQVDNNMSDLIYHLKKNTSNINMKLQMVTKVDKGSGVNYISPVYFPEDMDSLEIEEIVRFIKYIKAFGWYERIVIDFTSVYSRKNKELLETCNRLILINNGWVTKENKLHKFLAYQQNNKELISKIVLVQNDNMSCYSSSETPLNNFNQKEIAVMIPYCDDIHREIPEKLNINIDNSFGYALKKLIKVVEGKYD